MAPPAGALPGASGGAGAAGAASCCCAAPRRTRRTRGCPSSLTAAASSAGARHLGRGRSRVHRRCERRLGVRRLLAVARRRGCGQGQESGPRRAPRGAAAREPWGSGASSAGPAQAPRARPPERREPPRRRCRRFGRASCRRRLGLRLPGRGICVFGVPAAGLGTSVSTLSVEISSSGSSASTCSPSCLSHRVSVPSETETPICGITTSTAVSVAMRLLPSTPRALERRRRRRRPAE